MDASNFVAPTGHGTFVVVVNGVGLSEFISQAEAERAYRAARGELDPVATIPVSYPEVTLDCSHGQGAPVNGGCWCCRGGLWATDPAYCREPLCHECGNCPGGAGAQQPAPQPSAPTSPESGLPPVAVPGANSPPQTTPGAVIDVDTIASRLGVTRGEVYALAGIAAAVLVLR